MCRFENQYLYDTMKPPESLKGYYNQEDQFDRLPGKRHKKKQALMLEVLASYFEKGRRYTEREVNHILNQHHTFKDSASLRRLMLGMNLLDRTVDGKMYWRI